MADYILQITINSVPNLGEFIDFNTPLGLKETFVANRFGSGQSKIGANVNSTASFLEKALLFDFSYVVDNYTTYKNSSNAVFISVNDNIIKLYSKKSNFWSSYNTDADITSLEYTETPYEVISSEITPVTPYCDFFKLSVETNNITNYYVYNGNNYTVNSNTFELNVSRQDVMSSLSLYSDVGENILLNYPKAYAWSVDANVYYTLTSGAQITITPTPIYSTEYDYEFEYSLDGVNYSSGNVFSGLIEGEYTYYVKDNLGCEKTGTVTVVEDQITNRPAPYFFIDLQNSFFFAKRTGERRNVENTLSYDYRNEDAYKYLFEIGETRTIQFRSSYLNHKVSIYQNGIELTDVPVNQKSNNINIEDVREAIVIPIDNGSKIGVRYSDALQVLDPITLQPTGYSTLDGTLLGGQEVGAYVFVDNYGWLQIDAIADSADDDEDFTVYGEYMVFDTLYTGTGQAEQQNVKFIYNLFDYEVYEFDVDFSASEGCYQVGIKYSNKGILSGSSNNYLSEAVVLNEDEEFDNCHFIEWSNTEPNQINWDTEIKGKGIFRYDRRPTFIPEAETEQFDTDTATRQLDATIKEKYEFHFKPMPLSICRQLSRILTECDTINIDGIYYINDGVPELEPLEGSDYYNLIPTMIRTTAYNSNELKGNSDINTNVTGYIEVDADQGYLKL